MACLSLVGKQPVANDALKSRAMNGDSCQLNFFTSYVGTGSDWHVLLHADVTY